MEAGELGDIQDLKLKIQGQIAHLSKLLGLMPDNDVVKEARTSFLKLSTLISRALDIQLQ